MANITVTMPSGKRVEAKPDGQFEDVRQGVWHGRVDAYVDIWTRTCPVCYGVTKRAQLRGVNTNWQWPEHFEKPYPDMCPECHLPAHQRDQQRVSGEG